MSDPVQTLRFAVGAAMVAILVGAAAVEVQGRLAGEVRAVPESHARSVFDRDFDIGEDLPVGHCGPDAS